MYFYLKLCNLDADKQPGASHSLAATQLSFCR